MKRAADLVARPIGGLLPVRDAREKLNVLIASLAPGGAERIVVEWLSAEIARGREVELAVVHPRRNALPPPRGARVRVRGNEDAATFLRRLASDWAQARAPVSTHLVADSLLRILWEAGVRTIPTVHNVREGWRNEPGSWSPANVPMALACAEAVREQLLESGCRVPVIALRHRPGVGAAAFDDASRRALRAELGIGPRTFLLGAVGALKPQKDYRRAIEVLAQLCTRRDAALVIVGGILDRAGLRELDRVMDAAISRGVAARLRLPGFVSPIEPYLAACDALLNVSRFEGLSIAVQEALAAGLPVVATDVGGQGEINHPALRLVPHGTAADAIAKELARHPVRAVLSAAVVARAPRAWSVPCASRNRGRRATDTLFVTANLNAGGAQRSLVNLAGAIAPHHALSVAVCGESTHAHFARSLADAKVETFRPAPDADPFAVAESLLAHAASAGARNICFWNADPRVKLLLAKFAPAQTRLLDASPGAYAFEELERAAEFAESISFAVDAYYRRLDVLVLKYRCAHHPRCRRVEHIPNGVGLRGAPASAPRDARYLVSGRIAPTKRLDTLLDAFARLHALHPRAELHVVGPVEERDIEYAKQLLARASGLPVRFRGAGFDLAHLEEPFTAAIVLGTHQGCPNAVLEAMAAGIPVVANDSGGTREILLEGECGWLLPEDADASQVAEAMRAAFEDRGEAVTRAVRARARVVAQFGLEAMARRYLALLRAETPSSHENMEPWTSASALAAPPVSSSAISPVTAAS